MVAPVGFSLPDYAGRCLIPEQVKLGVIAGVSLAAKYESDSGLEIGNGLNRRAVLPGRCPSIRFRFHCHGVLITPY
jgi:hypothetical protein